MLRIMTVGAGALLLLAGGFACSDDDGGDAESRRDEFVQDAEDRLSDLRTELDQMRDDISSGDAEEDVREQADQLEQRINDAEAELDEIRAANADEWEEMKDRFDSSLKDVENFADYMILAWYTRLDDWGPDRNWYGANRANPPGPFQFYMWDAEYSLFGGADPPARVHPLYRRDASTNSRSGSSPNSSILPFCAASIRDCRLT